MRNTKEKIDVKKREQKLTLKILSKVEIQKQHEKWEGKWNGVSWERAWLVVRPPEQEGVTWKGFNAAPTYKISLKSNSQADVCKWHLCLL